MSVYDPVNQAHSVILKNNLKKVKSHRSELSPRLDLLIKNIVFLCVDADKEPE